MKKLLCGFVALFCLLGMFGCRKIPNESTEAVPSDPVHQQQLADQQPMVAAALPVTSRTHTASDGAVVLQSIYQNMELTMPDPEVADKIIVDFLNRLDPLLSEADMLASQAEALYTPEASFTPYLSQVTFTPMRLDQGVFSLYGTYVVYEGISHPEVTPLSASYDLTNGNALTQEDILVPGADFSALLPNILASLSLQEDSLYADYAQTVEASLQDTQNWYLGRNGLVFYFSPYEIASYAAGVITAEVSYSDLTGILNDAYFPAEKDTVSGQLEAMAFEVEDATSFSQIAEVVCETNGPKAVLYTHGRIEDFRILSPEGFTVFAAAALTPGDGVILQGVQGQSYTATYQQGELAATAALEFSPDGTIAFTH